MSLFRRPSRIVWYLLCGLLVPCVATLVGTGSRLLSSAPRNHYAPAFSGSLPEPAAHDPAKRTAVIIAANSGTEGSDFLAPYEVIGRSQAFNLYAVAPERELTHLFPGSPMLRGVDMLPHYSFAQYDAQIGHDPDLIVIPFLPFSQAAEYQQILDWVRRHAGPDTTVLSICAGATNLADTGLLAGRKVTTHHYSFSVIAQAHPDIELVQGVRYVEDGNFITSAGVTAGVDGSLFALKRIVGEDVALRVAREINYPYAHFLDDANFVPTPAPLGDLLGLVPSLPNMLLSGLNSNDQNLGVALYSGMSELALASLVDTLPHVNTLTVHSIAPQREVLVSHHGLQLVPRWSYADAPALDRIVVPGLIDEASLASLQSWSAERAGPAVEQLHLGASYVYQAGFEDMARNNGSIVAAQTIYLLEFPGEQLPSGLRLFPPTVLRNASLYALLGLLIAGAIDYLRSKRHQARRSSRPSEQLSLGRAVDPQL
jgi:Transcriptional regulator containing an amidase domain and an AraC-type DNA-binding HTH domain